MEMPLKDENWAEIVELARQGDFVTLVVFYPREAVLYFANLQAIALAVPLAKKPALKRCAASEFFDDPAVTPTKKPKSFSGQVGLNGGVMHWFSDEEYVCEVCKRKRDCRTLCEFSYTSADDTWVHVDRACPDCTERIRSGDVPLFYD